MARVCFSLGSNVDPIVNLRLGVRELRGRFGDLRMSNVYRSAALGFIGADFLNLVLVQESDDTPAAIHEQIEIIHNMAGRQRGENKCSSRPLDIDLLLYDDLVVDEPVQLPRADVLDYSFVLRPLAELAPDLIHPVTGKCMDEHWQEFDAASHPLTPVCIFL